MATLPFTRPALGEEIDYPSGDSRPVGETPCHINNMVKLRDALDRYYADNPTFFAAANMFVYYVPGERLKHVSPDVFVVFGVPRDKPRKKYLVWEEGGRTPDLVIELTSASTRDEDVDDKMWLYRQMLSVREYILFDPYAEYLDPPLQRYRLEHGEYLPIEPVAGRLPSQVLGGLQFERDEGDLRIYDPVTNAWLPTEEELRLAAEDQARRVESERVHTEEERQRERDARLRAEEENERLRQEIERLRRASANGGNGQGTTG
ncbi:MAG TPA: Uma2 family endonuclease [Pirellulales bacterium]|nr:Uma2 family endonuclease [Pirellulales bacterium]